MSAVTGLAGSAASSFQRSQIRQMRKRPNQSKVGQHRQRPRRGNSWKRIRHASCTTYRAPLLEQNDCPFAQSKGFGSRHPIRSGLMISCNTGSRLFLVRQAWPRPPDGRGIPLVEAVVCEGRPLVSPEFAGWVSCRSIRPPHGAPAVRPSD
jgi:hypothetical protein